MSWFSDYAAAKSIEIDMTPDNKSLEQIRLSQIEDRYQREKFESHGDVIARRVGDDGDYDYEQVGEDLRWLIDQLKLKLNE